MTDQSPAQFSSAASAAVEPADDGSSDGAVEPQRSGDHIEDPARLVRLAAMLQAMASEVKEAPMDDEGLKRVGTAYNQAVNELVDLLPPKLEDELTALVPCIERDHVTESELRLAQAQLVGWLQGLFQGIQASMLNQQQAMALQQAAEQQRSQMQPQRPGTYL